MSSTKWLSSCLRLHAGYMRPATWARTILHKMQRTPHSELRVVIHHSEMGFLLKQWFLSVVQVPMCFLCRRRWRGKQACLVYAVTLWGALALLGPWIGGAPDKPQIEDREPEDLPNLFPVKDRDRRGSHVTGNLHIRQAPANTFDKGKNSFHNSSVVQKSATGLRNSRDGRLDVEKDGDVLVRGILSRLNKDQTDQLEGNLRMLDSGKQEQLLFQVVMELFAAGGTEDVAANLTVSERQLLQTWLEKGLQREGHLSRSPSRTTGKTNLESRRCNNCFQRNFQYVLNSPDTCRHNAEHMPIDGILLILSSPDNFLQRQTIRETWADARVVKDFQRNPFYNVKHVFILGTPLYKSTQSRIEVEHRLNRDIVQQDFKDSYQNLTLKTLMGLDWAQSMCPTARYVIKVDDDVYLNPQAFIHYMDKHNKTRTVFGRCSDSKKPIRQPFYHHQDVSKWVVKEDEYPWEFYPAYCEGPVYAMSMTLAKDIVRIQPNIPYFRMEDVYIGLCLQALRADVHYMKWMTFFNFELWQPILCYKLNYEIARHKLHHWALLTTYKNCFRLRTNLTVRNPNIRHRTLNF